MNNQAQQIHSFLLMAAQSRGGILPSNETQPITDWYTTILDSINCINLVINGDADISWDIENNEPIFALTDKGYKNADPDLRGKAINKNAIN